jgi:hypothetical protein
MIRTMPRGSFRMVLLEGKYARGVGILSGFIQESR